MYAWGTLYHWAGKEREVRLLLLGLDSAGKTTILRRINNEDISSVAPSKRLTLSRRAILSSRLK